MDVIPLAATTGTGGVPVAVVIPVMVVFAAIAVWYRFFRKR